MFLEIKLLLFLRCQKTVLFYGIIKQRNLVLVEHESLRMWHT